MPVVFFFIGGVGPKTVALDDPPRSCPSCGRTACRHLRVDEYLSLFFIPVFRLKKGASFWACRECGASCGAPGSGSFLRPKEEGPSRCPTCGRSLDPDFTYCPKCGFRV